MLQYVKLGVQFTQRLCITDLTVSPFVVLVNDLRNAEDN
jgi:hypothetical protein